LVQGVVQENINFGIDDVTEVFNGCSFTLKNEFWVAGGSGNARTQVRMRLFDGQLARLRHTAIKGRQS